VVFAWTVMVMVVVALLPAESSTFKIRDINLRFCGSHKRSYRC
jgi:hypothetical protein